MMPLPRLTDIISNDVLKLLEDFVVRAADYNDKATVLNSAVVESLKSDAVLSRLATFPPKIPSVDISQAGSSWGMPIYPYHFVDQSKMAIVVQDLADTSMSYISVEFGAENWKRVEFVIYGDALGMNRQIIAYSLNSMNDKLRS